MIDVNTWGWPQWLMLGLTIMSALIVTAKHGQPQKPYNMNSWFISSIISYWILIAGGFFS
ncbi:hypothetical protein NKH72_21750 [Mesorhizobium sp. M0955]|uniref:hypothetical protein n=1 Tax=Mesorhizobium sp. M0955 TaxID=2957033 RepID=UPI0033389854